MYKMFCILIQCITEFLRFTPNNVKYTKIVSRTAESVGFRLNGFLKYVHKLKNLGGSPNL